MAHAPRTTTLPHPGYSTREIYAGPRPSYIRTTDHLSRSSSFANPLRRHHPLSPTPSPSIGFTSPVRMDLGHQYGKSPVGTPPLMPVITYGQLVLYSDGTTAGGTNVTPEIIANIDKGFFLSDGEWTCYRRNYFSCVCSFGLSPNYPNATMHYIPSGSSTSYQVYGFAMSISAVVADSDSQSIDLVQHTPKRDKGPTAKPEKVKLFAKPQQQPSHQLGLYQDHHAMAGGSRAIYEGGYGQSGQGPFATEHTFERIQFKQATANNGKRRAAQQYYHLVIELYVDVGTQTGGEQYIKIADRKSEKMIVRGRSPGHYQTERRGSTSSGPGGSSGMGSYPSSQVLGGDYGAGSSNILPNTYSGAYEARSGHYTTGRHHDIGMEPLIPADEAKAIEATKEYQYYPSTIYEGVEARQGIEMFSHRHNSDAMLASTTSAVDSSKVKHEYDHSLPSIYQTGSAYYPRSCNRFEGRATSTGYYPTPLPQSG